MTLRDLSLKQEYRSDRDDVVSEFFIPCLTNSIQYDRTIEFISVKSLSTLTFGLENIQDHHAKIRLVSGHRFTTSDLNAIVKLFDHHNPSRLNGRLYLDKKISNLIQDNKIIGKLGPRQIFGEFSKITNRNRFATVITKTQTTLLSFNLKLELFDEAPFSFSTLYKNILTELVKKIDISNHYKQK